MVIIRIVFKNILNKHCSSKLKQNSTVMLLESHYKNLIKNLIDVFNKDYNYYQ